MIKYKIIILGLALLILLSCGVGSNNCEVIALSKSDKDWFQFYKKHSAICFLSNFKNKDTLIVNNPIKSVYTTCNKFELSGYQYEELSLSLKPKKCYSIEKDYCEISINFTKHLQKNMNIDCHKSFRVYDLCTQTLDNMNQYMDTIYIESLKKSVSCFTFSFLDTNFTDLNGGDKILKDFSWSKEYGLIRYELNSGEKFELFSWER